MPKAHHTENCPASQRPRDAQWRRARQEGDRDQDAQVQAVKQMELQRRHGLTCAAERQIQAAWCERYLWEKES